MFAKLKEQNLNKFLKEAALMAATVKKTSVFFEKHSLHNKFENELNENHNEK